MTLLVERTALSDAIARSAVVPHGRPDCGQLAAPTFAALDLGSNNCRLMIATPASRGFRVLDSFSRIVRLGEGLQETGALSAPAMERALGALHSCADLLGRRQLRAVRAVATEACRRASNGRRFLDRVRDETGLAIDVISSREEAELALESCAALLHAQLPGESGARSRGLLFDIGGASTEIAWVRLAERGLAERGLAGPGLAGPGLAGPGLAGPGLAGPGLAGPGTAMDARAGRELIGYQSAPLGVITLAERFGADMFEDAGYEAMVEHVSTYLRPFDQIHCIGREVRRDLVRLLGTSGTVTTLASVALELPRYRRSLVDGVSLTGAATRDAITQLRRAGRGVGLHRCVGPDRANYVLPGCAIFEAIHRLWPARSVTVADRGLRDGMLLRMIRQSATRPRPGRSRILCRAAPGPAADALGIGRQDPPVLQDRDQHEDRTV